MADINCRDCKAANCRAHLLGENASADAIRICRLRNEREDLRGGLELATEALKTATELNARLEREVTAWEKLAEATVAINLPRAFFWKGAKGRFLVRFAGGESTGEGSFTAAAVALAESIGLVPKLAAYDQAKAKEGG